MNQDRINARAAGVVLAVAMALFASTALAEERSYAEDRAEIENLMARYLFGLDWRDPDLFVSTFAEGGVLNYGGGEAQGHEALWNMVNTLREADAERADELDPDLAPPRGRHAVSNIVIDVRGDAATARAYWTHFHNNNDERIPEVTSYGHYEDELVREDGRWLFTRRHVFNERVARRAATGETPVD